MSVPLLIGELQERGENGKPLSCRKIQETVQSMSRMLVHGNRVPELKNPQAGATYTTADFRDVLKAVSFVVAVFVSCIMLIGSMFMYILTPSLYILTPSLACISYLISYNIAR